MTEMLVLVHDTRDRMLLEEAITHSRLAPQATFVRTDDDLLRVLDAHAPKYPRLLLLSGTPPGVDLPHVIRTLRHVTRPACVPIVVLTARTDPTRARRCYDAGANAYTITPIDLTAYIQTVHATLQYWLHLVCVPNSPARSDMTTPRPERGT